MFGYRPELMIGYDISPLLSVMTQKAFLVPQAQQAQLPVEELRHWWIIQQLHHFECADSLELPDWPIAQYQLVDLSDAEMETLLYRCVDFPRHSAGRKFLTRQEQNLLWLVLANNPHSEDTVSYA